MRVLIAGEQSVDREQGRRAALRSGLDCTASECVSLVDLELRLSREPEIDLVVVCLDPEPSVAIQTIQSVSDHFQQPLYAVTTSDVSSVIKPVQEAGAVEVWPMNEIREGLVRSTEEISRGNRPASNRRGRLIAVTAALPGSGVTTVASGLAFGLAGTGPVVLAELGAGVPELALDLNLSPRHSLAELIAATDRMDSTMLRDTIVPHAAGVDVLAHLPDTPATRPLSMVAARDFQILLRNLYDWVVVDAGHPHSDGGDHLVRQADQVVIVTRIDTPALRTTRKYVQTVVGLGIPVERIMLLANRYGQSGLVPWRKAQEALKLTVRAWLPDDPRSINRSLVEGQPLIEAARRCSLSSEFLKLAKELQTATKLAR